MATQRTSRLSSHASTWTDRRAASFDRDVDCRTPQSQGCSEDGSLARRPVQPAAGRALTLEQAVDYELEPITAEAESK
jgi:hypothetical protein